MHPARTGNHVGQVLIGICIQSACILPLKELTVCCDHPERLFQIVACGIRELLEILVCPPQLLIRPLKSLLCGTGFAEEPRVVKRNGSLSGHACR